MSALVCRSPSVASAAAPQPYFKTRGIVLCPTDLSIPDWPRRAAATGLTTVAMHNAGCSVASVVELMKSDRGQQFLRDCKSAGLHVEYELHAMRELLPRSLFKKAPEMFRINEKGERTSDSNCCVHSKDALDLVVENALQIAETLKPTTGRYFYWGDDGAKWCNCPRCKGLTSSDQAIIVENTLLKAIREKEPGATLAHLTYHHTLRPPRNIKPASGIFMEFAPIQRSWNVPYESQANTRSESPIQLLEANFEVFPAESAQVLEYWLDSSKSSGYSRPAKKVFFDKDVFAADIASYGRRGIRNVTSFACWIDEEYLKSHGEPPLNEYGKALRDYRA